MTLVISLVAIGLSIITLLISRDAKLFRAYLYARKHYSLQWAEAVQKQLMSKEKYKEVSNRPNNRMARARSINESFHKLTCDECLHDEYTNKKKF